MANPGCFEAVSVLSEVWFVDSDQTLPVFRNWHEKWLIAGELGLKYFQGTRIGAVKGRPGIDKTSWWFTDMMVFGSLRIQ